MFEFYDKDSLYPELKHMESPKVFFETVTMDSDIMTNKDFHKFVELIDGAKMTEDGTSLVKNGQVYSITKLPNSLKTIANHMFLCCGKLNNPNKFGQFTEQLYNQTVNFTYCGFNAVALLLGVDFMQRYDTHPIYTDVCCFDLRAPFVTIKFNKKEMLPFQAGDILLEKLKIPENLIGDDLL